MSRAALLATAACRVERPVNPPDLSITIPAPDTEFEGVEPVRSAVELPDGRLLVSTRHDVLALDFASHHIDTLGRQGEGPGEYREPFHVGWLRGGRPAVLADQELRLVSWDGAGGAPQSTRTQLAGTVSIHSAEFDSNGTVVGTAIDDPKITFHRIGDHHEVDTVALVSAESPGGRDTLGMVTQAALMLVGDQPRVVTERFAPVDAWGVTISGVIWSLSATTFQAARRRPGDSTWRRSVPRAWHPIPTGATDRRKVPDARNDSVREPLARYKPPFTSAVADSRGEVWAALSEPDTATEARYAVFPADGSASRIVVGVPRGDAVIALGQSAVYLGRQTDDGRWVVGRARRPATAVIK